MSAIVVVGGSRGLGRAFCLGLPDDGDKVYCISRSEPCFDRSSRRAEYVWIDGNLSQPDTMRLLARRIQDPVDLLVYNAGIWEQTTFAETSDAEIVDIVNVNLTSALLLMKALIPQVVIANGRIVVIGSTCGLENEGTRSVAYAASKFGLRGLVHSLREVLRERGIPVTCISPGSIATDVAFELGRDAAIESHKGKRIPVQDLVDLVRCIRGLSKASCVKEIDLPALLDTDA